MFVVWFLIVLFIFLIAFRSGFCIFSLFGFQQINMDGQHSILLYYNLSRVENWRIEREDNF